MGAAALLTACNQGGDEEETAEIPTSEAESFYTADENGQVSVYMFSKDVPEGTKITNQMVEKVTLPIENLPTNLITDILDARGKYTTRDFYKGDYVIKNQLTDEKPAGTEIDISTSKRDFVVVTDYIEADTGKDLYTSLQAIIDKNPGRTLFFPDGEYVISQPLLTSSVPKNSTSFYLSSGAVLRAADNWRSSDTVDALIGFGTVDSNNDIQTPGSNFYVMGGILDGNGKTSGVCVDKSRETLIKDVLIKDVYCGISIYNGINNKSADADIDDVTIIGNGKLYSVGIKCDGLDNTISNVRIYNTQIGIDASAPSFISNCLVENTAKLPDAVGYKGTLEWASNCVAVDCAVGFVMKGGLYEQCRAVWTYAAEGEHVAFSGNSFSSVILSCKAEFFAGSSNNYFLKAPQGGNGKVISPVFDKTLVEAGDVAEYYVPGYSAIISPAVTGGKD